MPALTVITTGSDQKQIDELHGSLIPWTQPFEKVESLNLGMVEHLGLAYHEAILSCGDELILILHQDVRFASPSQLNDIASTSGVPEWIVPACRKEFNPLIKAAELLEKPNVGLLGVAGSHGLLNDMAWWQYPDLSGVVIHTIDDKPARMNPYGPWGNVLAVDGLVLLTKREKLERVSEPSPGIKGFHFYDMDFSLRMVAAGLEVWTIPLIVLHSSGGATTEEKSWLEGLMDFSITWGNSLPATIPFKPLRF